MKNKQKSQFDVVVLKLRPLIYLCRSTATNRVPVKNRRYELLYIDILTFVEQVAISSFCLSEELIKIMDIIQVSK